MIDIKKISSEDLLRELIDRRVLDTHTYFTINEKEKEARRVLKLLEKYVDKAFDTKTNQDFNIGLIRCSNCSQYTHKGNFCEQCGHKLTTINHSVK